MKPLYIALIVCSAIVLLFILFIIFIRMSNKKRYNRLQENLRKLQQENDDFDNDNRLELDDEKLKATENRNSKPIIEEYSFEDESTQEVMENDDLEDNNVKEDTFSMIEDKEDLKARARKKADDDFNEFMKEHSFSRKILDEDLIEKFRGMPQELQDALLTSVFQKFEDDND